MTDENGDPPEGYLGINDAFDFLMGGSGGGSFDPNMAASGVSGTETTAPLAYSWPDGEDTPLDEIDPTIRINEENPGLEGKTLLYLAKRFTDRFDLASVVEVGEGGMGKVYSAIDKQRKRKVAIKEVHPDKMLEEITREGGSVLTREDISRRFLDEFTTHALLSHPNIVKCFDLLRYYVGKQEIADGELRSRQVPILAYTQEFIEAPTLENDLIARIEKRKAEKGKGPLYTLVEFLDIAEGLASALAYAHSQGVIHRDVKPQNVLVPQVAKVKLMDFGIAKPPTEMARLAHTQIQPGTGATGSATVAAPGTHDYMAPEARYEGVTNARTDIYSYGQTLFHVLTGKYPPDFRGDAYEIRTLLDGARSFFAQLPGSQDLLRKCLYFEPTDRVESMDEVLEEIQHIRKRMFGDPDVQYAEAITILGQEKPDYTLAMRVLETALRQATTKRQEDTNKWSIHHIDTLVTLVTLYSDIANHRIVVAGDPAKYAALAIDRYRHITTLVEERRRTNPGLKVPSSALNACYEDCLKVLETLMVDEKEVQFGTHVQYHIELPTKKKPYIGLGLAEGKAVGWEMPDGTLAKIEGGVIPEGAIGIYQAHRPLSVKVGELAQLTRSDMEESPVRVETTETVNDRGLIVSGVYRGSTGPAAKTRRRGPFADPVAEFDWGAWKANAAASKVPDGAVDMFYAPKKISYILPLLDKIN